ncbi:MAG: serine/threonine-protein kinase [Phycisphaerales bacterium]
MTPERQRLVEEVFLAAIEAGETGWGRVIDERCGSDVELRFEVEGLLGCHKDDGSGGVLDRAAPVGQSLLNGFEKVPLGEVPLPPTGKIGHYKISRVLGAGGMGAVYVGEQERPRRTVALKVIRPGYRSQQVLRRMEHEAELLGRLQHPGIAQIYEAGTADAWGQGPQPYFAMELVDGPSITEYANSKKLDVRERLELMARVCDAVQHAHQRGVIHRDIKPGNILVGQDGEKGQPKILDFGVARATANDLYVTTLQTSVGQMIGTLPYMSPEQVAADPDQIDTRTDVYSLGVVLFELLAGKLPHDVRNRPIPEAARVIRDEEPTRLGSVRRELSGEVETIVARAMEKDKSRRYGSAAELAADIRRYLAGEPIWAKRDSAFYVIGKTLARRKGVAALLLLVAALVVGFGVYAGVQASQFHDKAYEESLARGRADSALELARAESARNEGLTKRLEGQLTQNEGLTKRLEGQLAASQIERGRLEAVAESPAAAERFLWTTLLNNPQEPGAWWGLRELYGRYPCEWDVSTRVWLTDISCRNGLAAVCDRNGGLRVISASDGSTLASFRGTLTPGVSGAQTVAFVSDDLIICFYYDGAARAYAYRPGQLIELWQWQAHRGVVTGCRMAPGGDAIASVGFDGAVRVWSLPGLALETTIKCGGSPLAITFSPDGRQIAVGFTDGTAGVWSRAGGPRVRKIEHSDTPVSAVLFSRDGRSLFCGGSDRRVDAWSLADGTRQAGLGVTNGDVRGLEYAPIADSRQDSPDRIAVVGGLGTRVVTQSPTPQSRLLGFSSPGFSEAAWSGNRLISVSVDGHIRCWDTRPQPSQTVLGGHWSWVFSCEFSPDGKRLAVTGGVGMVKMYDAATLKLLWETAMDGSIPTGEGRPRVPRLRMLRWLNSEQLVTGGADGLVRIQNASDGSLAGWFKAGTGEIYGLSVSADGKRIATVATDRAVRVWDMTTRTLEWEQTGLQVLRAAWRSAPTARRSTPAEASKA